MRLVKNHNYKDSLVLRTMDLSNDNACAVEWVTGKERRANPIGYLCKIKVRFRGKGYTQIFYPKFVSVSLTEKIF